MAEKYVFIGNSIVAGYPWSKSKSFVGVLNRVLRENSNESTESGIDRLTEINIINKGVNGDTTAGILTRFNADVLKLHPAAVFILTGTNDFIYREARPDQAFANLERMADMADTEGIDPILITPLPVDAGKAEYMWLAGCGISYSAVNRNLDEFSQMIRKSGRAYIDFNREYLKFAESVGDVDLAYLDGLHPMPDGHRFLAEVVLDFLTACGRIVTI